MVTVKRLPHTVYMVAIAVQPDYRDNFVTYLKRRSRVIKPKVRLLQSIYFQRLIFSRNFFFFQFRFVDLDNNRREFIPVRRFGRKTVLPLENNTQTVGPFRFFFFAIPKRQCSCNVINDLTSNYSVSSVVGIIFSYQKKKKTTCEV